MFLKIKYNINVCLNLLRFYTVHPILNTLMALVPLSIAQHSTVSGVLDLP
jgi:hypothetical protein